MRDDLGFSTAQLTGAYLARAGGLGRRRHRGRPLPRPPQPARADDRRLGRRRGLVVAWSQVDGLLAFYAVWAAIGLAMATVLYEPAFIVLAKQFTAAPERRRAMTALTLVAALASFIFLPLSQALIDAYGWRDALLVLAVILAVVTVPLHASCCAPLRRARATRRRAPSRGRRSAALAPFWLLSAAFFVATLAAIAMIVSAIPFLLERGHSAGFAAFAVGLSGLADPRPAAVRAAGGAAAAAAGDRELFVLIAARHRAVSSRRRHRRVARRAGPARHGQRHGDARAGDRDRRPLRAGAYGTIAGVAGSMTTAARAAGPFAAALYAGRRRLPRTALDAVGARRGRGGARLPRRTPLRGRLSRLDEPDAARRSPRGSRGPPRRPPFGSCRSQSR